MAQNNSNSVIIGFAISGVLAAGFAIAWYMSFSHGNTLEAQIQASKNKEQELNGKVEGMIAQLNTLRGVVAPSSNVTVAADADPESDVLLQEARKVISEIAGDGTAASGNLIDLARSTKSESDQNQMTATVRKQQLDSAAIDLQNTIAQKDALIEENRKARDKAEQELAKKEAMHAEQMKGLEDQIRTLRDEKTEVDNQLAAVQDQARRDRENWAVEREEMSRGLVALRGRIRDAEDPTFSRPDGVITSVDHNVDLVFIDLGTGDGLQKGATFSVYSQDHSGVGRSNTSDIKGKLEVTELLGLHRAKARIIDQDVADPIAPDDPIYSPIFQPGQTLEIAVAGQINVDGLEREEFRRLVRAAGSKISVEVGPMGQFIDPNGNELSEQEARSRITPRTRYLVIGDIGDPNVTNKDPELETMFKTMRDNKQALEEECEILGIYPIGLSAFLEHIGFSPKQQAWTPESGKKFPSTLANGARSAATNTPFGNRESSAAISGLFNDRRKASTESTGNVSKIYSGR